MEQRTEPQKTRRKKTTLICFDFAKLREKEQNHKYINIIDINCRDVSFTQSYL